ncbi:MAG: MBG domain-containing protein, partial [Bacteroidota bacterium]
SQYYNCFWDNQASGQTSSAGGTGKSNAAMKNVATYTDLATAGLDEAWDFKNNPNDDNSGEDIWKMELSEELNDGYPVLSWQVIPLEAPSVSTLSVQAVGSTYAAARGYISDLGNPNPTQHGVCYNRTGNPTLEDDKTEQGPFDSPAIFLAPLEDLLPDRTYYLKAYAINDVDTVFGEEVSFTTDKEEVYFGGSFTVADKEYDATTDAVIAENNLVVNGAADGDDVVFENVSVEFASADAADDIEVNIVNAELGGDDSEHYEFISWAFDNALSSTGNIIKKELTVTADDVEREQCAPNPSFTFAYAGFVDGEDESFLTTEPVLNCSADASSLPGEYDITLSGGEDENYDFNYVNGTLTIIEDTTNPVAVSQDLTIALDAAGTASITVEEVDNGSTDNCGIDEMLVQPESFNCAHIGENEVTLTVTDAAGNEHSETAIITVEDNLAPTVITKDITVELNADGQASVTTADIDDGSSDNCSIETIELDITDFDCSNVGENVVALTAVDPSGNTTSQNATVTVVDETAPEVITQDITLELDANGQAAITTDDVDNGSSDNCSIDSYQMDVSSFDCQDIGEHVVTLTVTDANGNTAEETAVVTVQDNMAPTVITQDMTVELDVSGVASISIEDIDNGSFDNCAIDTRQLDVTSFDCSDVGDNAVTLTVTDVNGNEAQQTAIVTVEDNIAPTVFTQDTLMELNPDGEASILPIEVDDGSHDNCAIDSYELDQFVFDGTDIGENVVTLTVTDNHGNISTETAIITIADNAPPTIITQPVTLYLDMNGEATLTPEEVDNGSYDNVEITDMEIDLDYFACDDTGEHTVMLTANDISGNSSSAAETVTVLDTITPSALQVNPEAPLCYGSNEGQIEVIPQDGFGEMAFSIDNGATWQQGDGLFTDLTAGTYDIVVESANGCLLYHDDNPIVFEEPEELVIDELEVTNVTCNGASNGMIDIEAAGGTGAHYFSVDGGDTWQEGQLLYGLPAGSYEVKVMDDNGCVTPYSENPVEISEPEALVYEQVLTTDVTCNGSASGTIEISASGGTGTIEYSIGDDIWQTDGLFDELEAGEYELRIRDDRNCLNIYDDNPVALQEPGALVIDEVTSADVNCYGGNDGNIELTASGGSGELQYSIDDGESWQGDNIFSNLESGDYNVLVKDENECVTVNESNPVTVDQPDELVINQVTPQDLTCFGADDGQITIEATGGSGEIQYAINNEWQVESIFSSLSPGEYEIEVMDENECLATYAQNPVNIEEPEAVAVEITASADTAMVDETITLTAESNYSDAECYWEPLEEYGAQMEVSEMVVGEYEYTVTATNENGCEATDTKMLVFTINTGQEQIDDNIKIVVMPNPTSGKFAVHVEGMREKYDLTVLDNKGSILAQSEKNSPHRIKNDFNLSDYPAGVYFLRITSKQQHWIRKIVVQ